MERQSELIESVTHALGTDYAILDAVQPGFDPPDVTAYAATTRGAIALMCGSRHARVRITLERWTAPPPADLAAWEDRDELPFEAVDGAGPLVARGFDEAGEPGLDVEGLGRARVRMSARGRHRYGYDEVDVLDDEEEVPEEWLVQLWPDPDGLDALAGEPRREAGPSAFATRPTPWLHALHGWEQTGWTELLSGFRPFRQLVQGFRRAGRPTGVEEPLDYLRFSMHGERPSLGTPLEDTLGDDGDRFRRQLRAAAGSDRLDTLGDLFDLLLDLGLLARLRPAGELVPNPAPRPAWDVLDLSDVDEQRLRSRAQGADYGTTAGEILHLLSWAPGHTLRATPLRIAVRLAVDLEEARGALRLLVLTRAIDLDAGADGLRPDDEVVLRQLRRRYHSSRMEPAPGDAIAPGDSVS